MFVRIFISWIAPGWNVCNFSAPAAYTFTPKMFWGWVFSICPTSVSSLKKTILVESPSCTWAISICVQTPRGSKESEMSVMEFLCPRMEWKLVCNVLLGRSKMVAIDRLPPDSSIMSKQCGCPLRDLVSLILKARLHCSPRTGRVVSREPGAIWCSPGSWENTSSREAENGKVLSYHKIKLF